MFHHPVRELAGSHRFTDQAFADRCIDYENPIKSTLRRSSNNADDLPKYESYLSLELPKVFRQRLSQLFKNEANTTGSYLEESIIKILQESQHEVFEKLRQARTSTVDGAARNHRDRQGASRRHEMSMAPASPSIFDQDPMGLLVNVDYTWQQGQCGDNFML
jgi:predicted DNA-binding protein